MENFMKMLKYPERIALIYENEKVSIRCCVYMRCVQQTICGKEE